MNKKQKNDFMLSIVMSIIILSTLWLVSKETRPNAIEMCEKRNNETCMAVPISRYSTEDGYIESIGSKV